MYCPLTGKPCDKAKNIHLTDIIDGEVSYLHICQDCACELDQITGGVAIEPPAPPNPKIGMPPMPIGLPMVPAPVPAGPIGFFMQLLKQLEKQHREQELMQVPCPLCGQTLQDVVTTGRIGCPRCYDFFKEHLSPLIHQAQEGHTHHVGKKPKPRPDPKKAIQTSLDTLHRKMDQAVKDERYEDAGLIRDQIAILKKKQEFEDKSD